MSAPDPYAPKPVVLFEVWEPKANHPLVICSVRAEAVTAREPGDRIVKRLWVPASAAEPAVGVTGEAEK